MSVSLALSICVLFISLMQLVNGTQLLLIIFFLLFGFSGAPVFGTVIAPLQVHMHHCTHIKLILTFKIKI